MDEDAAATVRAYYDALSDGEPLGPFFLDEATTVKFGVGERLTGGDEVKRGLRDQTRTTTDWTVDSERLLVESRECHGWFSDDVFIAWTDTESETRHEFDTRWSGPMELTDEGWRFAGMHVSVPVATGED